MVTAACADAPTAGDQKPVSQTSPAHLPSPTPSPSPSPLPPLTITAAPFHAGEIGLGYTAVSPTATGGAAPYAWDISEGALPTGLVMGTDGQVTGTPTNLGTYLFTVRVADSVGGIATLTSSVSISKRLVVTGTPCTPRSPCSVEAGCATVCGTFAFHADGIGPYSYAVTSGALPTGMGLNGLSLTNAFPAPPSSAGRDWVFTVRVTDAIGATAQTTAQFHVFPHIAFSGQTTSTCAPPPISGTGCSLSPALTYSLGTPGLTTVSVVVYSLPAGQSWPSGAAFIAQNGSVTGIVCGGGHGAVRGVVTLALKDTSTCAASQYCASGTATVSVTLSC